MREQLIRNYSIDIKQTLYTEETPEGQLSVFETIPFGRLLMLNDEVLLSENDSFFYHEMLTHPALFTHPKPKKVAIIGNGFGILQEVLKHNNLVAVNCINNNAFINEVVAEYFPQSSLVCNDPRITHHTLDIKQFLNHCQDTYDVIIKTNTDTPSNIFSRLLNEEGILVQPQQESLFQLKTLKSIYQPLKQAGFNDVQVLHFPQPSHPLGWRLIIMATKLSIFKKIQEKYIFNRQFTTRYYNFDTHQAAFVLPEFMREEIV